VRIRRRVSSSAIGADRSGELEAVLIGHLRIENRQGRTAFALARRAQRLEARVGAGASCTPSLPPSMSRTIRRLVSLSSTTSSRPSAERHLRARRGLGRLERQAGA